MAAVSRVGPVSVGVATWPKWQVALVLGAPLAVGVGYWYYKSSVRARGSKMSAGSSQPKVLSKGADANSVEALNAKEKDPLKRAQNFKLEGNKSFKAGKYEDAIDMYSKAIEVCPVSEKSDLAMFHQNRAAAYEQMRNFDKVKEDCSAALELNPQYLKALHRRAKAHEHCDELAECLEDITAVCILEGFQNQSSLIQADRILKSLGHLHAKEALLNRKPVMPSRVFIRTFLSSFSEDPIQKMVSSEYGQVKLDSEDISTKKGFERAKHAFAQEEFNSIVTACSEEIDSVEADGGSAMAALLLRGTFHLLMGEIKSSLSDLEAVIENDDADVKLRVNALIKRASLHVQMDDPVSCLEDFERAASLDPSNSDVYHHRGQMNLLLDKAEDAMRDLEKAVSLNPSFPIAYVQKCYTEYRFQSSTNHPFAFKTAKKNFEEAITRFPNCTECYMLYAQILTDKGKYADADQYFEKAISIDPSNATLLVHRGLLHLQWTSDAEKAIRLINEAVKLDSKCEFAYETLGTIEVQRGNLKEAIELFDKAIPLAKTEFEMSHLFALRDAAVAQEKTAKKFGLNTGL